MIRLKSYSKITKQERVDDRSFSGMIFSSVLGIVLCMICLAGLTWAWFSDSASSSVNTLSAARFDVSVAVTNTTTQVEEQPQSEKQFALSNGTYAVTLTGTGNAQTYGGYCTLTLGSDTYHTVQLRSGEQFTFTLTVTSAQTVSFTVLPQWGTYAGSAEETLIGTDSAISYTDPTGINETTDVSQTQESLEPQQSTQPVQNTQSVQNTEDSTIDNTTDGTEETVQTSPAETEQTLPESATESVSDNDTPNSTAPVETSAPAVTVTDSNPVAATDIIS